MENKIKLTGSIKFEPEDKTKKHKNQASWKKVAMVMIDSDICEYYAWFINKRYNLILNRPLRKAHISFINDSMRDLTQDGLIDENEAEKLWKSVKEKWEGKKVEIILDIDVRTDGKSWWLNIPHDERGVLQGIRSELGLGKPYYGMHMSVGYARPGPMEDHSAYLHESIEKGFI